MQFYSAKVKYCCFNKSSNISGKHLYQLLRWFNKPGACAPSVETCHRIWQPLPSVLKKDPRWNWSGTLEWASFMLKPETGLFQHTSAPVWVVHIQGFRMNNNTSTQDGIFSSRFHLQSDKSWALVSFTLASQCFLTTQDIPGVNVKLDWCLLVLTLST